MNGRRPALREPGYLMQMANVRGIRGKYLDGDSQLSGLQKRLALLKERRAVSHRRFLIPLRQWLIGGRSGCIGRIGLNTKDG